MLKLDHLVVSATNLDEARAHVETALGVPMQPGGSHAIFETHNTLLGLADGIYLEAIAPIPNAPAPTHPRLFDLDRFEGLPRLSNWVCSVPDLEHALDQMPFGLGQPLAISRGSLSWRMAVSQNGTTPFDSLWPTLIEWPAGVHPSHRLASVGVKLRRFTLVHPEGDALRETLVRFLKDERVAIETGPKTLHAVFETPHGDRSL